LTDGASIETKMRLDIKKLYDEPIPYEFNRNTNLSKSLGAVSTDDTDWGFFRGVSLYVAVATEAPDLSTSAATRSAVTLQDRRQQQLQAGSGPCADTGQLFIKNAWVCRARDRSQHVTYNPLKHKTGCINETAEYMVQVVRNFAPVLAAATRSPGTNQDTLQNFNPRILRPCTTGLNDPYSIGLYIEPHHILTNISDVYYLHVETYYQVNPTSNITSHSITKYYLKWSDLFPNPAPSTDPAPLWLTVAGLTFLGGSLCFITFLCWRRRRKQLLESPDLADLVWDTGYGVVSRGPSATDLTKLSPTDKGTAGIGAGFVTGTETAAAGKGQHINFTTAGGTETAPETTDTGVVPYTVAAWKTGDDWTTQHDITGGDDAKVQARFLIKSPSVQSTLSLMAGNPNIALGAIVDTMSTNTLYADEDDKDGADPGEAGRHSDSDSSGSGRLADARLRAIASSYESLATHGIDLAATVSPPSALKAISAQYESVEKKLAKDQETRAAASLETVSRSASILDGESTPPRSMQWGDNTGSGEELAGTGYQFGTSAVSPRPVAAPAARLPTSASASSINPSMHGHTMSDIDTDFIDSGASVASGKAGSSAIASEWDMDTDADVAPAARFAAAPAYGNTDDDDNKSGGEASGPAPAQHGNTDDVSSHGDSDLEPDDTAGAPAAAQGPGFGSFLSALVSSPLTSAQQTSTAAAAKNTDDTEDESS